MHFEKVSKEQFKQSFHFLHTVPVEKIEEMYDKIILPSRSTSGSVGYDFHTPFGFELKKHDNIIIPTGIRAVDMLENIGLFLFPRSGQGFKLRFALANTVGVIDSDYMNADNEGHIMVKLSYDGIVKTSTFMDIYKKIDLFVYLVDI